MIQVNVDDIDTYFSGTTKTFTNKTFGGNVTITNDNNIVFGTGASGSDKYIRTSNNKNLLIGSSSTGNVVINQGNLVLSHGIVEGTSLSSSIGSPTILTVNTSVTYFYIGGTTDRYTSISGNPSSNGAVWHVLTEIPSTAELIIDFGANGLVSGTGPYQYLTFNADGQSASMIYFNSKWRIINTGASVS